MGARGSESFRPRFHELVTCALERSPPLGACLGGSEKSPCADPMGSGVQRVSCAVGWSGVGGAGHPCETACEIDSGPSSAPGVKASSGAPLIMALHGVGTSGAEGLLEGDSQLRGGEPGEPAVVDRAVGGRDQILASLNEFDPVDQC